MRKVMHHIYRNHKNKGEQTSTAIKRTTLYYVKRVIFNSFLLTALLGFFLSNILTLILLAVYFVAHEKQQDKKDQHL